VTNPFPSTPTAINIRTTADEVAGLFASGRSQEAVARLEQVRQGERPAVREALDRYVADAASEQLTALRQPGAVVDPAMAPALQRLASASDAPRTPIYSATAGAPNELAGLTSSQQYDVYASMVHTRGTQAAQDALGRDNERVILGLRQENSTLLSADGTQSGRGVYDDQMVVMWKDARGVGHVQIASQANTEPTAQYDHHAGSDGNRMFAEDGRQARRTAAAPGYEGVTRPRKIEGDDVNGDGLRDLGRLAEGTIEMGRATHANPLQRGQQDFSLRPTDAAVAAGAGQVQRDTNGDGRFTNADAQGVQDLNNSFKIHRGSRGSTDSAGCQTIHPAQFDDFMGAVQGHAGQNRWQYVLSNAGPQLTTEQLLAPVQQADAPAVAPAAGGRAPVEAAPAAAAQDDAALLSNPGHPQHAMYRSAVEKLEALGPQAGFRSEQALQNAAGQMVFEARFSGLDRIDHVVASRDGHGLIAVQGELSDPAMRRVLVDRDQAAEAPLQESSKRLADTGLMEMPALAAQQQEQERRMAI